MMDTWTHIDGTAGAGPALAGRESRAKESVSRPDHAGSRVRAKSGDGWMHQRLGAELVAAVDEAATPRSNWADVAIRLRNRRRRLVGERCLALLVGLLMVYCSMLLSSMPAESQYAGDRSGPSGVVVLLAPVAESAVVLGSSEGGPATSGAVSLLGPTADGWLAAGRSLVSWDEVATPVLVPRPTPPGEPVLTRVG
ncbi:MAG: hypothetical protein GX620_10610 [Chloroflexi bacterium]|nr:hypothetical protein [Chloroflexota bacterium]